MKERADKVLADRGLVSSRSQAKSLIEKGDVLFDGKVIKKAGELINPHCEIEINAPLYVGRGAFKLEKALDEFQINPKDLIAIDVGASTGGFTEILLLRGARKVYAIDVGHDQLAQKIREDSRVVNLEGTNIRDLDQLDELADLAVMDISFISITKVLGNVSKLLTDSGKLVALIKPQFEAGTDRLPKDGVIKDKKVREEILKEVVSFAEKSGWVHHQTIQSPIEGKTGNVEYLSLFSKNPNHSER
ncbi:MAG TPA: TlyA family RNA methyltransferase [Bacteriovoracaceae bacterium]|nr:TlyA family RNA methyltransferase [Bacteriovoracaceae bacterium]